MKRRADAAGACARSQPKLVDVRGIQACLEVVVGELWVGLLLEEPLDAVHRGDVRHERRELLAQRALWFGRAVQHSVLAGWRVPASRLVIGLLDLADRRRRRGRIDLARDGW
jgi:hypothetical protein